MHCPTRDSVGLFSHVSRVGDGHMPGHSVPLFRVDFEGFLPAQSGFIMYPGNGIGHFLVGMSWVLRPGGRRTTSVEEIVYPGLLSRIS